MLFLTYCSEYTIQIELKLHELKLSNIRSSGNPDIKRATRSQIDRQRNDNVINSLQTVAAIERKEPERVEAKQGSSDSRGNTQRMQMPRQEIEFELNLIKKLDNTL